VRGSRREFIPLRAATEGAYHGHDGLEAFIADMLETFELHVELCDVGARPEAAE
jgi:hypothetical protein